MGGFSLLIWIVNLTSDKRTESVLSMQPFSDVGPGLGPSANPKGGRCRCRGKYVHCRPGNAADVAISIRKCHASPRDLSHPAVHRLQRCQGRLVIRALAWVADSSRMTCCRCR
jgi:hypothetical protein